MGKKTQSMKHIFNVKLLHSKYNIQLGVLALAGIKSVCEGILDAVMFMFMFIDTIREVGFRASRQLTMVKIHNFTLHITIGHTMQTRSRTQ